MTNVKVVQAEGRPEVPTEVIAQSVKKLAEGMRSIQNTPLNHRALVVLLRDATGLTIKDIEKMLRVLPALDKIYLKG